MVLPWQLAGLLRLGAGQHPDPSLLPAEGRWGAGEEVASLNRTGTTALRRAVLPTAKPAGACGSPAGSTPGQLDFTSSESGVRLGGTACSLISLDTCSCFGMNTK